MQIARIPDCLFWYIWDGTYEFGIYQVPGATDTAGLSSMSISLPQDYVIFCSGAPWQCFAQSALGSGTHRVSWTVNKFQGTASFIDWAVWVLKPDFV